MVKNPPANAGRGKRRGSSLGWEDPLEAGTATPSSALAWRIQWAEEPGRLQSMGVAESQTRPKRLSTAPLFIRLPSCGSSTLNPMTFDLPPWPTLTPSSIIQPPPRVQRPQGTETQGPVSSAESAGAAQLQEGGRGRGGAQAWEHLWRQQISPLRY